MNARIVVALLTAVLICGSVSTYAAAPGKTTGLVDIELKNVPVRQAIESIFDGRGLRYVIEPGVSGKVVELKLKGVSVAEALKSLGDAAGFTYKLEEGVYVISPKSTAAEPPVGGIASGARSSVAPPQLPATPVAPPPAWTPPPAPASASPVMVNTYIPSDGGSYAYAPAGYGGGGWGSPFYGGFYSPFFTIGPPPYVVGQWPNPPPPPGWVSTDWNRLLQFQWVMTRRPSFITPY